MTAHAPTAPLDVMRAAAALLDEGMILIDGDDRVALVSDAVGPLLPQAPREGDRFAAAGTDYRLIRLVDSARSSGRAEERELVVGERNLLVRTAALGAPEAWVLLVLEDRTRLLHLERVRADFVSNISHELRTPVTAIRLMAETLRRGGIDDREAALDFVRRITIEAFHLSQIVEELLELSAIESGLRPMERQTVDGRDLLAGAERLRPLADDKGVHLICEADAATPQIVGDVYLLAQVVRNLVHNAVKFTPQGGRVTLRIAPGAGDTLVITCADTGVGIQPGDLQRVFERFWKADSSRVYDGEGSGLGLAIVRHVVQAHGGTVTVESEPKHGAVFTVTLPAAHGTP